MYDTFERVAELGTRTKLHCPDCQRSTIHTLEAECLGKVDEGEISGGERYSIQRCGGCDHISYVTTSWNSEDYDVDDEGMTYYITRATQYPPPVDTTFSLDTEFAPARLTTLIGEMLFALVGSKYNLATVGLRIIIEFIVNHAKCSGRNLEQKIDALMSQTLIDKDQNELLHEIRKRGNAGAHRAKPMSVSEINAGIAVIQTLLQKLYNEPARHKAAIEQARRAFSSPSSEIDIDEPSALRLPPSVP